MILPIYHYFFCKFHMVCSSQPAKIWWQTSIQLWSTLFDLHPFWIFQRNKNDFCYKPIPNNAEFIFIKKNSEKTFKKNSPYWPLYIINVAVWIKWIDKEGDYLEICIFVEEKKSFFSLISCVLLYIFCIL